MEQESENRRQYTRLMHDTELYVRKIGFPLGNEPKVKVEMNDISEGGIGFLSPQGFSPDDSLEVIITLPGWIKHTNNVGRFSDDLYNQPLTAVGQVKRCDAGNGFYQVGVMFTNIWADHWRAMRQYIKQNITQ